MLIEPNQIRALRVLHVTHDWTRFFESSYGEGSILDCYWDSVESSETDTPAWGSLTLVWLVKFRIAGHLC